MKKLCDLRHPDCEGAITDKDGPGITPLKGEYEGLCAIKLPGDRFKVPAEVAAKLRVGSVLKVEAGELFLVHGSAPRPGK
jgi:hypothetical protein